MATDDLFLFRHASMLQLLVKESYSLHPVHRHSSQPLSVPSSVTLCNDCFCVHSSANCMPTTDCMWFCAWLACLFFTQGSVSVRFRQHVCLHGDNTSLFKFGFFVLYDYLNGRGSFPLLCYLNNDNVCCSLFMFWPFSIPFRPKVRIVLQAADDHKPPHPFFCRR